MSTVRVTAPYVTLRVKDANGAIVTAGYYEGALVESADSDDVARLLRKGMVEEVGKTSASETVAADDEPAKRGPGRPRKDES